jgi:hypothetical protein
MLFLSYQSREPVHEKQLYTQECVELDTEKRLVGR